MFTHVFFDLDGTLTDSAEGITKSLYYAADKLKLPRPSPTEAQSFLGPPLLEQMQSVFHLDDAGAETMLCAYRERFSTIGLFENRVYDGIPTMLSSLRDHGIVLAVATSKPEVYAKQILAHFSLDTLFDSICGSELSGERVHKTDVCRALLSRYPDARALMVGDRHFDIDAARTLGIASCAVRYGYAAEGELEKAHPDYLVDTPLAVLDIALYR